jgi:hypothetical protein
MPARPSPVPANVPDVTQALPAVSPAEPRSPARVAEAEPAAPNATAARSAPSQTAEAKPAASAPAAEVVAALPDRPGGAAAAATEPPPAQSSAAAEVEGERLAIVFPSNSSYFPPGTGSQLRSLLQTLAGDRRYEVVLQSSVSGSQQVVGAETAEEAARYNQWLAERRLERVQDWLAQNAAGSKLVIKPEYRQGDDSRQVLIRILPTG